MGTPRKWTHDDLRRVVPESKTVVEVIAALGLSTKSAGNWRTVSSHIKQLELDTSHFDRSHRNVDLGKKRALPLEEVLVRGSQVKSSHLKSRLLREGRKTAVCEECGLSEWRGRHLPMELDHVNGDSTDNRIGNLKILCPNCHSLTPTWRGKNKKNA